METPNSITTIADDAIGVFAASAGIININGVTTISTGSTGEFQRRSTLWRQRRRRGVEGQSQHRDDSDDERTALSGPPPMGYPAGDGGTIDTAGTPAVNVTTYGDGAIGVYASTPPSPSTTPSTITIGGPVTIVTNGGVATIDNDDLGDRRGGCSPTTAGR